METQGQGPRGAPGDAQGGREGQGRADGEVQLTEHEAFRRIQKLSMNNRKSMREVAEAILLAEELNVE